MNTLSETDLQDLKEAKTRLEHPGLAARLADAFGRPIEAGFKYLPRNLDQRVSSLAEGALMRGLGLSIASMKKGRICRSHDRLHQALVAGTGAVSGAAGMAALAIELPLSTLLIMRSIADIARSEGFDLNDPQVRLSCLEVMAFGGRSTADDAVDSGYWMVRGMMAHSVSEAAAYIAEKGLTKEGGPALARLIALISSRFGVVATQAAAAKAIPVIGAFSGCTVNYLFMHHFQEMARGHFTVRRLESKYGRELVERVYNQL